MSTASASFRMCGDTLGSSAIARNRWIMSNCSSKVRSPSTFSGRFAPLNDVAAAAHGAARQAREEVLRPTEPVELGGVPSMTRDARRVIAP
jgi:hypothetical protein